MNWAEHELSSVDLSDKRLNKRLIRLVTDKLANPTASIPEASRSLAASKAAYRFFSSKHVLPSAIQAAHRDRVLERIRPLAAILVLQDTTELDYTSHPKTTDLGYLDHAKRQGLKVHSGLATTLDGVPLGLLHQEVWTRAHATKGNKKRNRPQSEKESQRWLTTLSEVQRLVPDPTQLIVVADREADIYPLFAAEREPRVDLVVRATYDRAVVGQDAHLKQLVAGLPSAGSLRVHIPANGARAARDAEVTVSWSSLQIEPPSDYPQRASLKRPRLQVINVQEREPPDGVKPLHWLLWTTLELADWAAVIRVIGYYRTRWLIERYHYVLKSGCGIEKLQLETKERLERALAVYSIVAWRLLWLTYQARQEGERACSEVLAEHEWQALYCTIHRVAEVPAGVAVPSLRQAVRWIAQLGGFLGRKGDGEPGVQTIWRGLRRLEDIVATWVLIRGVPPQHAAQELMGN